MIERTFFHRNALLVPKHRMVTREAARGVAFHSRDVLMIFSPVNGDYKFPGGGVESGESHKETIQREVLEECGLNVLSVGVQLGRMVEYIPAREEEFDTFMMTSHYYECTVDAGGFREQQLDQYETDLGFTPIWISISEAIKANEAVLETGRSPRWTIRDTFFLHELEKLRDTR